MNYLDLIFTNHAQEQATKRGIRYEDAYETFKKPDRSFAGKEGGTEFHKKFDGFEITLIGKLNDKKEWIAISVWRNPPLEGTSDALKAKQWKDYRKAGVWGKIWINIKQQLGF